MKIFKEILKRLTLCLIIPAFLLILIEFGFRIFFVQTSLLDCLTFSEYKQPYYFLENYTNPRCQRRNSVKTKNSFNNSTNSFNIVIIGGSSAAGYPYDYHLSFPSLLRVLLQDANPNINICVYNMAACAQTYSFGLKAAQDVMAIKPDVLIVYSGHNERYEHNHVIIQRKRLRKKTVLGVLYKSCNWLEEHSRFFQFALDIKDKYVPQKNLVLENINNDERVDEMMENCRDISEQLIQICKKNGTKLCFSTQVANIRDYPPEEGNANILEEAFPPIAPNSSSNRDAKSCFQIGRWLLENNRKKDAKKYFLLASDKVHYIGRIHTKLQNYFRNISNKYNNVLFADIEKTLCSVFDCSSLGNNAIVDAMHPNIQANYEIAKCYAGSLTKQFFKKSFKPVSFDLTLKQAVGTNATRLIADGTIEGGFVNVQVGRPDVAKKMFLIGLSNKPGIYAEAKGLIGLALLFLNENNNEQFQFYSKKLINFNDPNALEDSLSCYRGTKELATLKNLLNVNTSENVVTSTALFETESDFGLIGSYYNGTNFSNNSSNNQPFLVRVDNIINFDWTKSGPVNDIIINYRVQWKGYLFIPDDGSYEIITKSDDGVIFSINDNILINNWVMHGIEERNCKLFLKKGWRSIQLDYLQLEGDAFIQLLWKTPFSNSKTIIPKENLKYTL